MGLTDLLPSGVTWTDPVFWLQAALLILLVFGWTAFTVWTVY